MYRPMTVNEALAELRLIKLLLGAGRSLDELSPRFRDALDAFIVVGNVITSDLWVPVFVGNPNVYANLNWDRAQSRAYIYDWLDRAPLGDGFNFIAYVHATDPQTKHWHRIYRQEWVRVREAQRRAAQAAFAMRQPQYDPNDNEFLASTEEDNTTE